MISSGVISARRKLHFPCAAKECLTPIRSTDKASAFTPIGDFSLPEAAPRELVKRRGDAHQTLGNVLVGSAALHAAAGFVHPSFMRGITLLRMPPLRALF